MFIAIARSSVNIKWQGWVKVILKYQTYLFLYEQNIGHQIFWFVFYLVNNLQIISKRNSTTISVKEPEIDSLASIINYKCITLTDRKKAQSALHVIYDPSIHCERFR